MADRNVGALSDWWSGVSFLIILAKIQPVWNNIESRELEISNEWKAYWYAEVSLHHLHTSQVEVSAIELAECVLQSFLPSFNFAYRSEGNPADLPVPAYRCKVCLC